MYKIFYSPILRTFLQKLSENEIAKKLLDKENTLVDTNINCIDLDTEGFVSFIQSDKANKILIDKRCGDLNRYDDLDNYWLQDMFNSDFGYGIWNKSRNQLKIGRFVNQLFNNVFSNKEVEDFVNLFKSKQNITDEFELVKGEDIRYWYNDYKYYSTCGDLGSSCMRYNTCQEFFDIYIKNPKCQLLILKKDNYLVGRALIWEINYTHPDFSVDFMMDRVYTNKPSDILKFHEYSKEKGWARKFKNTYSDENTIIYNDQMYIADIEFQLTPTKYDTYPYVDTFKFYNPSTGVMQNFIPKKSGYIKLEQTGGGYIDFLIRKYSNYYSVHIREDQAIWSEILQDWLYANDVTEITVGSSEYHGIYPIRHNDIGYNPAIEKYIHKNDSVYSRYTGYSFLKEQACKAYLFDTKYNVIDTDWICPTYINGLMEIYTNGLMEINEIDKIDDEIFSAKKNELNLDPSIKYGVIIKHV
jgi:hypothetical protein